MKTFQNGWAVSLNQVKDFTLDMILFEILSIILILINRTKVQHLKLNSEFNKTCQRKT